MRKVATAVLFALCVVAPTAWADSPVTVVADVMVGDAVADDEFLLEDGRRLFLKLSVDDPEAMVGRSLRIIATADPQATGTTLTSVTVLGLGPLETAGTCPAKSGDEIDVEGTVTAVGILSFDLLTENGQFQVIVNESTEYHEIEGLEDLDVGAAVGVKGKSEGPVITAEEVRLLDEGDSGDGDGDEDPSGVSFESLGQVVGLPEGQRILLDDSRFYETGSGTLYSDGLVSYDDLRLGMMVTIKAVRETSGVNRALEVELESIEDGVVEFEGEIQSVDLTGFVLVGGPRVEVVPSTVFDGDADRLEDLQPGWAVEVEAYQDLGGLTALEVDADDPGVAPIDGEDFEPQQALLVLADGAIPAVVADRYDAVVLGGIGEIAVLFWWEEEIDSQLLALMDSDPEIVAVEPNYLFRDPESVRRRYVVVDRQHDDREYTDQSASIITRLATAHAVADGNGSVIAVLDTGVDPGHPALTGRILDGGLDLVDGDAEPWESRDGVDQDGDGDVDEAAGHGTFVSSLVLLVAPGAKILPYRVLDDDGGGSAYLLSLALADAIEKQVDVISLSLVYRQRSAAVDLLLEQAGAQGIVVVAAAGNDGLHVLPFPASDRHTLAVTGMTADGNSLATFANRSPKSWLAGPSEEIYGALDGGLWGTWSGTSMAVPFVAGSLVILRQIDPGLDSAVFAELLSQTGRPLVDGVWTGVGLNLGHAVRRLAPNVERRRLIPAELR